LFHTRDGSSIIQSEGSGPKLLLTLVRRIYPKHLISSTPNYNFGKTMQGSASRLVDEGTRYLSNKLPDPSGRPVASH
jgi:hypothetical protein